MTVKIRYTYYIVTPESAEDGGYSESGWLSDGGHYDVSDETASEYTEMRASQAVRDIRDMVGCVDIIQQHGDRVTVYGSPEQDPYTGESETRAAHFVCPPRLAAAMVRKLEKR